MAVSPSATALWKAVVDRESERLDDASVPRKWRIASNLREECAICEEKGGVLIGCSSERCTKYVHLDCANQVEGLLLNEDGIFTFECEKHHKPPLFCSCRQKYDNTKEYISCDSCFEWYHHTCQKVTQEQKDGSSFVCSSCRALENSGKPIPQELKEGNLDKETRSNDIIRSEKIVGFILPLVLDVCPLIDSISGQSTDTIKFSDVSDAITLLSSSINNLSSHGFGDPADEEVLQKLGVIEVFNQWLNICEDFSSRWSEWKKDVVQLCTEITTSLGNNGLWKSKESFLDYEKNLIEMEDDRKTNFSIVEDDLESFQLLAECITWINGFLEAFFVDSKSDNWTQSMGSFVRTAQSKIMKKLNTFYAQKKDEIFHALTIWVRPVIQEVDAMVNSITRWHNSVCTLILGKDANWEIQEAEKLIQECELFPTMPPLRKDLDQIFAEAISIVDKFECFLSSSEYSEDVYAALMDEKDDIGLKLSFEDELDCIKEHGVFLKAYAMVTAEGRIHAAQARNLIANAQSVEEDAAVVMKNNFPIAQALHLRLKQAKADLQEKVTKSEFLINSLNIESLESLDASQLSVFQQLPIVTEEEEYLLFCKDSDESYSFAERVLSKEVSISLAELEDLAGKILNLVSNDLIPDLESVRRRKQILKGDLPSLNTLFQTANREWEKLSSALEDSKSGLAVSAEHVIAALQQCRNTQITNEELEQDVVQKLAEGERLSLECEAALKEFVTATSHSVEKSEALIDKVRHSFVSASMGTQMKLRYDTMKTVLSCSKMLQDATVSNDAASGSIAQRLNLMRELKMSLLRLSSAADEASLEATMIASIRDDFLFQQWREEVGELLGSKIKTSVSHAERLLEETQLLRSRLCTTEEFVKLKEIVEQCHRLRKDANDATRDFQELLGSFLIPSDIQVAMDVDGNGSSDQLVKLTKNSLTLSELWSTKAGSILERARSFASMTKTLPVMDDDISDVVAKLSHHLETIENVFSTFRLMNSGLSMESSGGVVNDRGPFVDAKFISDYQAALQDILPQDAPIIVELHRMLGIMNSQVQRFVETYANIIPPFFTRQRNRADTVFVSKEFLVAVLNEPIARAIRTPIHSRLQQVRDQVSELRAKIKDFLIQSNQIKNVIKVGDQAHDDEEDAQLRSDLVIIENLHNEAESIPLEIPETKVIVWLKDLFEWISRIPLPNTTDFEIDYEEALTCKKEAVPLIQEIPGATISELISMGVMDTDENGTPSGFVADAHFRLQNAGDYFEHLENQIGLADVFALKVERILASETLQLKDIENLLKEKDGMVVLPSRSCLRMLDRALEIHRQKKVAGATSFVQQKVEKKMTAKLTEAAAAAAHGHKKSSRLCARGGCSQALIIPISSAFCSDTCAVKSIEELTKGIVKYKTAIQAQKQAAAVGANVSSSLVGSRLRVDDVKAFDLNAMKKSVDNMATASAESKSPRSSMPGAGGLVTSAALNEVLHRLPAVANDILRLEKLKEKAGVANNKDRSFRLTVRCTLEDIFGSILSKLAVKAAPFHASMMAIEIEQGLFEKYEQSTAGEYQKHFRMLNTNLKRPNNEYLVAKLAEGETSVKELLSMTVKQFADQELQQQRELQKEAMAKSTFIEKSRYDELERRRREAMSGATEAWRDRSDTATTSSAEQFTVEVDPSMMTPDSDALMDVDALSSPGHASSPSGKGSFFRSSSEDSEGFGGDGSDGMDASGNSMLLKRTLSDSDNSYAIDQQHSKKARYDPLSSPRRSSSTELTGPSLLQRLKDNSDLTRSYSGDSAENDDGGVALDSTILDEDEDEKAARQQEETLRRLMEEDRQQEKSRAARSHQGPSSSASSSSSKPATATKISINAVPSIRLLSKESSEQFSITRPSGAAMRASALVSDKRMQGLIKGTFNIDGRTKIADLEKFLGELLAHGKKTVAVALFMIAPDNVAGSNSSSASYQKFTEEFSTAERAGMCNASANVQVYLVPPSLQASLSILRDIRLDSFPRNPAKPSEFQHQLLFAIIVAKESGPANLINRNFPPLPLAPNSFNISGLVDSKATPALLPVASATTTGPSFQRPTAFDSIPRPAMPLAPAIAPMLSVPVSTGPDREQMRQVAEMCARQGPQSLDELRATPQNRFKLPFIYDGNAGYETFKMMIIEFARNMSQQATSTSNSFPSRPGPMNLPAMRPTMPSVPTQANSNLPTVMSARPLLAPSQVMGGFPRPMTMGGPQPMGVGMQIPPPQIQQPPTFPGQQPPRRSRFG